MNDNNKIAIIVFSAMTGFVAGLAIVILAFFFIGGKTEKQQAIDSIDLPVEFNVVSCNPVKAYEIVIKTDEFGEQTVTAIERKTGWETIKERVIIDNSAPPPPQ